MNKCQHDQEDQKDNGLMTKIWGEAGWKFGHAVTFGYPRFPTEKQKQQYKVFFILFGVILPCGYCRESYKYYIKNGDTKLTDSVMQNRDTLTYWFYLIHQAVNKKLGIEYHISFQDVVKKFESFRARCDMNDTHIQGCQTYLDYRAMAFQKNSIHECCVIPYQIALPLIHLAKIRGLNNKYFCYLEIIKLFGGKIEMLQNQTSWNWRNQYCFEQIQYMRKNSVHSIELDGKWKGTPTKEELKLILCLCSNLTEEQLVQSSKILENISHIKQ